MTNDVEIAVKENTQGDGITFELTRLPSDPQLDNVLVRYRLFKDFNVLSWTDSDSIESPQLGDTVTINGLTEGALYEFFPVAVDDSSKESEPGSILRAIPSSGSTLTKIMQAIASELSNWVPEANIRIADEFEGKFDPGERAAIVEPESASSQRVFNTLSWATYTVKIHLVFGDRDLEERRKGIEGLATEVRDYFEKNSSCFGAIGGYYDTRSRGIEFGSASFPAAPGRTTNAVVRLDCIVEES